MLPSQPRARIARHGWVAPGLLTGAFFVVLGCGDELPVEPPPNVATTVTVSPESATLLALGDTVRFSATVLDQVGRVMAAAIVEWSSSDEVVAVVDGTGMVTSVGNGTATVSAASGGAGGEAVVTVEQVVAEVRVLPDSVAFAAIGDTVQLVAEAFDANGHGVAGAVVEWSSGDTAVMGVDSVGVVTAVGNGTATVAAGSGGVSGQAVVTVEQVVAEVRVLPDSVTFAAIGDTVRLVAEAMDANGHGVAGAVVEWSSGDTAVARVDRAGLVTAMSNGTSTVTAGSGGIMAKAAITVGQVVAQVRVTPDSVAFAAIGDTARLVAEVKDANGQGVAGAVVEWSSSDTAVAVVDSAGLVTAVSYGEATVTARSAETTGTASVLLDGQREVLRAFYEATGGPRWVRNDNWLTDAPLADWYGITTDSRGRVTEIVLQDNRLTGHLPSDLGALTELAVLELSPERWWVWCTHSDTPRASTTIRSRNAAFSQINPTMSQVEDPILSRTGVRFDRRGSTMEFDVGITIDDAPAATLGSTRSDSHQNRLTGPIPPEIAALSKLTHLRIAGNQLSGPIPAVVGQLTNLTVLDLTQNQLSGPIPREIGNLSSLERLLLADNGLTGPIPSEMWELRALETLMVMNNNFDSSLPPGIDKLTRLQEFVGFCASLTGPVPSELASIRTLERIRLGGNQFSGSVPAALGNLASLEILELHYNQLRGEIPSELGRLSNLEWLYVDNNGLSGRVPPELARLSALKRLHISNNLQLTGQLPLGLTGLRLEQFGWSNTDLCVPRNRAFHSWLARFRSRSLDRPTCAGLPTEVLEAFYEATGGSRWTRNGNWLSESPLSSWYGVTFKDSLVTGLDLSNNGLTGALPSEVGEFVDVVDLNLSGNELSGPLPGSIGDLERLETLDLGDNGMEGALPGTIADLGSLKELRWRGSGACAPEAAWFQTWLSSLSVRDGAVCDAPFLLLLPGAHLTQATQDLAGTVPIIAGRPALLRVFATVDRANDHQAGSRVAFHSAGRPPNTVDMALESARGIPDVVTVADVAKSYNAEIPGSMVRQGMEMVVEVDPDGTVAWAEGSQVRLPDVGRLGLDVRELPTMAVNIVPVVAESSADRSVVGWVESPSDAPIEFLRSILPIGELDLVVREPLIVAQPPKAASFDDWLNLLQDISLLRRTEGDGGYWYGVVQREGGSGIGGIAYLGGRTSLGLPNSEVFAHEIGHNMSLRHAPCGGPRGVDADFPYWDGSIGVPGYDPRSGRLVDALTPDVMSYCEGAIAGGPVNWISDYHFTKAMQYRLDVEAAQTATAPAPPRPPAPRLLVRGGITPDGDLHLDPAFVLDVPAKTPTAPGPYRIAAVAANGSTIFEHSFDMDEISIGGGGFLFLLPFGEAAARDLARIVLTGPDGAVQLDRDTRVDPVAIVMDRATGRIRSILRGEAAVEAAQAQAMGAGAGAAAADANLTLVSHGLPTQPSG